MAIRTTMSATTSRPVRSASTSAARRSSGAGRRVLPTVPARVATIPWMRSVTWQSKHTQPSSGSSASTAQAQSVDTTVSTIDAENSAAFKLQIDENELMSSTWEHRAWVWGTTALLAKPFFLALMSIDSMTSGASVVMAFLAAYYMADFGTGVYHWSVDNYGSGETPIVGKQIAAFQGHHVRPWTITQREFCNNVHLVFRPAFLPALILALSSDFSSPIWNMWSSTFVLLACMSQQFHAWSHMKKSQLPSYIITLQDMGILISRKAHGAHHRAPFEGNYCIVSGFWNPMLDKDGADDGFFRRLERFVAAKTGVEPRCWYEPAYEWAPEELPDDDDE